MILVIGFLLLVSMVITTILSALTGSLGSAVSMPGSVGHGVNFIVSFAVVTLLFAMIFKVLPDVTIKWRHVWIGAVFTSLLFTIGKHFLGLYLGRASTISAYGAAGSLVLILLWVYYSSLILFSGAEFTKAYAKATGTRIVPSSDAVPVTAEALAEQGIPHKQPIGQPVLEKQRAETAANSASVKFPNRKLQETLAEAEWKNLPRTAEIIRAKPWPYVGAALGLGFATGWVLKHDMTHPAGKRKGFLHPSPAADGSAQAQWDSD